MIRVQLENISKRYGYQTILKDINFNFEPSTITGITGRNGSGKSTLVKIISSHLSPSAGSITYKHKGKSISNRALALNTSFAAPYIKVTQELSLQEMFEFQQKFVSYRTELNYKTLLDIIELPNPKQKEIRFFSSGMQQKVNLAMTILQKSDLLILDEPTSYLDQKAKDWFTQLLAQHIKGRTVVISSNDKDDFKLVEQVLTIESGKFT